MENGFFRFQVGNNECVSLYDGTADYQLDSMVVNAPRSDVESALHAHGLPTQIITTPFTSLYVNTGKHRVLVDTGAGALLPTTGKLLQSLRNAEIKPESIDSIFLTHAHADHVGGVTDDKGNLIFTRATYFICKAESDFWFSEDAPVRAGEWMTNLTRGKLTPIKDKIVQLERDGEILPGVSVIFAPGHTPGHMIVSFSSQDEQILYTGDTVLHPLHLEHPDWLPVFDLFPEAAAASKQRVFDLAASSQCWAIAQQFPPFPSLGHVVKKDIGWEWQPQKEAI
jgi:glyoxylase-like metal-dependent hydrolase (beta-lactamase superfamily II)